MIFLSPINSILVMLLVNPVIVPEFYSISITLVNVLSLYVIVRVFKSFLSTSINFILLSYKLVNYIIPLLSTKISVPLKWVIFSVSSLNYH